jgi:hypothetical protein
VHDKARIARISSAIPTMSITHVRVDAMASSAISGFTLVGRFVRTCGQRTCAH